MLALKHDRPIMEKTRPSAVPTVRTLHQPRPSADDIRAAYSDISVSLHLLDMRGWYWTLADWLRLYEGLEAYLPPEDEPRDLYGTCFVHRGPHTVYALGSSQGGRCAASAGFFALAGAVA
jgi:hypothetical protein